MKNVTVQIRRFDIYLDQYVVTEQTWVLTDKLGRCSAPLVRSPEGLEIEAMPRSGKLLVGRINQHKLGFEQSLEGQYAKVLNWVY